MALSEAQTSRHPHGGVRSYRWLRASSPDADHLLNVPCSLPRWIDPGTSRSVWRGSPRGSFPSIALAFPEPFTGRHPRRTFRGLLKLHSRYGPLICSPTICGLGRKASTPPVPRRRRFSATQAYRYLLRWDFHPRVFRAVRAHNGFVSPKPVWLGLGALVTGPVLGILSSGLFFLM